MEFLSSPVGNQLTLIMYGIEDKILTQYDQLTKIMSDALKLDNFSILKNISYNFKPQGFTALALLAESHAAIHTYPEYNSLVFNLYTCRSKNDGRNVIEYLKRNIKHKNIKYSEKPVVVDFEYKG